MSRLKLHAILAAAVTALAWACLSALIAREGFKTISVEGAKPGTAAPAA